jgi:hypothetical protein
LSTSSPADPLSDFRNVLYLVWKELGLPDPTPVQYEIASWLQTGPRRSITLAYRGVGKSWEASAYCADILRVNPNANILVVSASKVRADDFSTFVLRLLTDVSIFRHLKPSDDGRNSKVAFDVAGAPASHAPSLKSLGITSQLAGNRADVIVVDDVETEGNSQTPLMREQLARRVKEFEAILKPGGRIIYLGTPQLEQSLYVALQAEGYVARIWPAEYPTADAADVYGEKLAPRLAEDLQRNPTLAGEPTDPQRFNKLELLERKTRGRSWYALQYLLDTRLSDELRYPLKLADLCVMDLDRDVGPEKVIWGRTPELELRDLRCVGMNGDRYYRPFSFAMDERKQPLMRPWSGSVLAIDPAGRGPDECAYTVTKMLNSQIGLLDVGGYMDGYSPETLRGLAEVARDFKVKAIVYEANFGDGMFGQLLKPVLQEVYPCNVEEVKHSKQKEKRIIDTLEPVMNSHRLIVDRNVIVKDYQSAQRMPEDRRLQYQLFYQITRLTKDKGALAHDDRLDALAIGVNYWVEQMARNIDRALSDHHAERVEKELRRFMGNALGYGAEKEGTWMRRPI